MKTQTISALIVLVAVLESTSATRAAADSPPAERITILPARTFPDYERKGILTTAHHGAHIHPIFELEDMNHDGRHDLVMFEMDGPDFPPAGEPSPQKLAAVYLQNPAGEFVRHPDPAILPSAGLPRDFLLADFNEDGHPDLLLNDWSVDLLLVLGKGDGAFHPARNLALNALAFPAIADLNGDKHIDIVAATAENAAMVFLGVGDGTFTPGVTLDTLTNPVGQRRGQLMIGDINRDSKPDIAVASDQNWTTTDLGNLDVFLNRGDGTFEDPIRNANVAVWRGALGDFNGDAILDYAGTRYGPEAVDVWLGVGDGTFKKRVSLSLTGYEAGFVTLGDLNADGMLDIVTSNTANGSKAAPLAIFLGKGDGSFQSRKLHYVFGNLGSQNFGVKIRDFNNDGLPDLGACAHTADAGTTTFTINLNRGSKLDPALGFQITVQNTSARASVLESSPDLAIWSPLATNTSSANWSFLHNIGSPSRRFYRTISLQTIQP